MTEQPDDRPQAPAVPPGNPPAQPQPAPEKRVEKLRAELAEAQAAIPPEPGTVRVKTEPPHSGFTVAGVTVSDSWTDVPAGWMPTLTRAAREAGVTLTEGEGA